jgi:hypothetical protein
MQQISSVPGLLEFWARSVHWRGRSHYYDLAEELHRFFELTRDTDEPLAMMSTQVDELWHTFLSMSESYHSYCAARYREFIHHRPLTSATLVPFSSLRRVTELYERRYGSLPPVWTDGVPLSVIKFAHGHSDEVPAGYKWSGWPGRQSSPNLP